ncbi:hypothetical protein ABPG74_007932 [Tetrahymena malaccensis]
MDGISIYDQLTHSNTLHVFLERQNLKRLFLISKLTCRMTACQKILVSRYKTVIFMLLKIYGNMQGKKKIDKVSIEKDLLFQRCSKMDTRGLILYQVSNYLKANPTILEDIKLKKLTSKPLLIAEQISQSEIHILQQLKDRQPVLQEVLQRNLMDQGTYKIITTKISTKNGLTTITSQQHMITFTKLRESNYKKNYIMRFKYKKHNTLKFDQITLNMRTLSCRITEKRDLELSSENSQRIFKKVIEETEDILRMVAYETIMRIY